MFKRNDLLASFDPELARAIAGEVRRQESHVELIASENYCSPRVMYAQGSQLTNKYAEGYPGKRYYGGCEYVDVAEQIAIDRLKKLFGAEARPVDHLRIRGEPGDHHLRLVFEGEALDLVVIDQAFVVDPVLHRVEQLAADVDLGPVGQVAAVGQRHAEDGVARIEQGEVDRLVGLRTGVRLHVGVVGTEQLLEAVDGQLLGDVHVFAATVVTLARVAFGVLVGQLAALRFHHPRAAVVLRRDQLHVVFLAAVLGRDGRGQFRVITFESGIAREHRHSSAENGPEL